MGILASLRGRHFWNQNMSNTMGNVYSKSNDRQRKGSARDHRASTHAAGRWEEERSSLEVLLTCC